MKLQSVNYGNQNKMSKKAQLKIQQMAFVLIAVTLLFAILGLMFLRFSLSGLKKSATELEEKNALLLVSKLANSPEFSCGESFGVKRGNCIDFDKVIALKENLQKYEKFWGVDNIEIRKIFPEQTSEKLCTISNYPNCNVLRIKNSDIEGYGIDNFAILCRKDIYDGETYDKCELARITLIYKEK